MLELLQKIGRAKSGAVAMVTTPFEAINASDGGTVHLPSGTPLEISLATGNTISATADLGMRLQRIYIVVEQYHCLDVAP